MIREREPEAPPDALQLLLDVLESLIGAEYNNNNKVRLVLTLFSVNKQVARQLLSKQSDYWTLLLTQQRDSISLSSLRPGEWTQEDCWMLLHSSGLTWDERTRQLSLVFLYAMVPNFSPVDDRFLAEMVYWYLTYQSKETISMLLSDFTVLNGELPSLLQLDGEITTFMRQIDVFLPRELSAELIGALEATENPIEVAALLSPNFPPWFDDEEAGRDFDRQYGAKFRGTIYELDRKRWIVLKRLDFYLEHSEYEVFKKTMRLEPPQFVLDLKAQLVKCFKQGIAVTPLGNYQVRTHNEIVMAIPAVSVPVVAHLYAECMRDVTPVFFSDAAEVRADYFLFMFLLRMDAINTISLQTVVAVRRGKVLHASVEPQ